MDRLEILPRLITRLALLVVLLAAQGLAAAHDLEHFGGHGESLCTVCSASHAQDAATLESGNAAVERRAPVPYRAPVGTAIRTVFASAFDARAPPVSL